MQSIKKITFGVFMVLVLGSFSLLENNNTSEELKWYDWNEGVEKARKEGKVALIDVYTDWCHWCKVMDKNTYTNEAVIALINKDFVPIKFNPELDKKYVNGKDTLTGRQLLGALSGGNSSGYPTTYFYLTKKNIMYQEAGYIEPVKFETILRGVVAEHIK
jgi:uncharacterized protein YyaL (SSP411 family)